MDEEAERQMLFCYVENLDLEKKCWEKRWMLLLKCRVSEQVVH